MKTKMFISALMIVLFATTSVFGQAKSMEIKTSADCVKSKRKIERKLAKTDGVKTAVLDLETNIITVSYQEDKVKPAELTAVVEKIGYTAEAVKPKSQTKKRNCCEKKRGCK